MESVYFLFLFSGWHRPHLLLVMIKLLLFSPVRNMMEKQMRLKSTKQKEGKKNILIQCFTHFSQTGKCNIPVLSLISSNLHLVQNLPKFFHFLRLKVFKSLQLFLFFLLECVDFLLQLVQALRQCESTMKQFK